MPRATRVFSPSSSAAKSSAAFRLPTPEGPWKRYACAGSSSSAAASRRFASCCSSSSSNIGGELLAHRERDLGDRPRPVQHAHPLREHRLERPVALGDGLAKRVRLVLDPV